MLRGRPSAPDWGPDEEDEADVQQWEDDWDDSDLKDGASVPASCDFPFPSHACAEAPAHGGAGPNMVELSYCVWGRSLLPLCGTHRLVCGSASETPSSRCARFTAVTI